MRTKREATWLLACGVIAVALCWLAPEYGFSPVTSITASLYVVSGIIRIVSTKPVRK
jgi:hypothetical protein